MHCCKTNSQIVQINLMFLICRIPWGDNRRNSLFFRVSQSRAALSLLGFCYYHIQDFSSAAECYEQLTQLHPEVDEYKLYYAQSLYKAGAYTEATKASFALDNPSSQAKVKRDPFLILVIVKLWTIDTHLDQIRICFSRIQKIILEQSLLCCLYIESAFMNIMNKLKVQQDTTWVKQNSSPSQSSSRPPLTSCLDQRPFEI